MKSEVCSYHVNLVFTYIEWHMFYTIFFVIFDSCSSYKHDILLHDHNARNIEISFHFTYHAVVCS